MGGNGEFSNNYVTAAGISSAYNPASPYAQSQQQVYGQGEYPSPSLRPVVHNLTRSMGQPTVVLHTRLV